jgi:hypothetical protein
VSEVFEAATGDGPGTAEEDRERRAGEVRTAFAGLLQIRRMTGAAPAPWERARMVRAVALTLEAAGLPPSAATADGTRTATGYRVGESPDRAGAAVRVEWLGPAGSGAAHEEETRLKECGRALESAGGWEALLYRGPRGRRFLEVEPVAGAPEGRGAGAGGGAAGPA